MFGGGAVTCKVNAEPRTDANSLRRQAGSGGRGAIEAIERCRVKRESSIFSTRVPYSRDAFSRKPISGEDLSHKTKTSAVSC